MKKLILTLLLALSPAAAANAQEMVFGTYNNFDETIQILASAVTLRENADLCEYAFNEHGPEAKVTFIMCNEMIEFAAGKFRDSTGQLRTAFVKEPLDFRMHLARTDGFGGRWEQYLDNMTRSTAVIKMWSGYAAQHKVTQLNH